MPGTRPQHGRRSQRRGQARRQAILDAALELFAADGYRGTGLSAIGAQAGVSHSAVLYHFGTAENLLLAVLAERDRRVGARLGDVLAGGGLSALARLPEVARINESEPGLAKLYAVLEAENLDPGTRAHRYFLQRVRGVHAALAGLVEAGQRAGEIRPDVDPGAKAHEIIAFMEGAQIQRFLDPANLRLVALYESYTAALVRDLAASPAAADRALGRVQ
ncbi:MAG: TetR/AcrR family transcriptional regulator [Proteobacteria bacterium]|nr:TetR/AcrR family transcriptional regulator [Pseudomonadota bacterium]